MEIGIIILLVCLIVIQQCFYSWQINKLINKAMSKNYAEYEQVKTLAAKQKVVQGGINIQLPKDDKVDHAKNLNSLFGL